MFYPQQGGYQQQARGLPTAFVGGYGKNKNRAQVFVWTAVATCLPATHELRGQALLRKAHEYQAYGMRARAPGRARCGCRSGVAWGRVVVAR